MAEWDLSNYMISYFDVHMTFPLLEFLSEREYYDKNLEEDTLNKKLDLLNKTNMVDFAMDVHKSLYPDKKMPNALMEKKTDVEINFKRLQNEITPVIKIFENQEVTRMINQSLHSKQLLDFLKGHNFQPEMVFACYNFAKFSYECGNYIQANEYLFFHNILAEKSDKNYLSGLWGKLATEILMQNWDNAMDDLNHLKMIIDDNTFVDENTSGSYMKSQQRCWLLHWSLFVFFNHTNGRDRIIELFLYQEEYLTVIKATCPWIIRYLAAAVINNWHRKKVMGDLINVIQDESFTYQDPIINFVKDLYIMVNFNGAKQRLGDCKILVLNDFFLMNSVNNFMENGNLMIFERFARK